MRKWSCKLQNKLEIRKALLKKREAISFLERKEAAEKAALHFQNAPFFLLEILHAISHNQMSLIALL